jgi:hypothetical protein
MAFVTDQDDLSAGKLPAKEIDLTSSELKEETQRLRWKTGILWGGAATALVFLMVLLCQVYFYRFRELTYTHTVLVVLVATIPSLIILNLMRLVSRRKDEPGDLEANPWYALLKELLNILSKKQN